MELRISSAQLRRAAAIQEKIEALQDELEKLLEASETGRNLSSNKSATGAPRGRGGKRNMSAAARARIARAQKARWAEYRKQTGNGRSTSGNLGHKKRRFSAAALARIAEAQRARWAKYRGEASVTQ